LSHEERSLQRAESHSDLNPEKSIGSEDPSNAWLVVDLLALGFDAAQLVGAVGRFANTVRAVRELSAASKQGSKLSRAKVLGAYERALRSEAGALKLDETMIKRLMAKAKYYLRRDVTVIRSELATVTALLNPKRPIFSMLVRGRPTA